ncbi:MAG: cytochrome c3 family protein [Desulfobulbaceae bacterium]|nr:cytochrome c3 family protein [Desulfobulbaceae bacterium]MCK5323824.1 cytochrome c3 family protein [Desulfobulbaceae bacterium]MCK5544043.1 cytochrome c3 family protein [Desulfobulbaceae bacterium]
MKRRSILLLATIFGFAAMYAATGAFAGTDVGDMIKMENKAYEKHKKAIVEFSHKKHNIDYKISCGECHHDEHNKPIEGLKIGDDVQNCIECHKIAGKFKKDAPGKKLDYHADAIHGNCVGCHKATNKAAGNKNAPATCTKCHPKAAK